MTFSIPLRHPFQVEPDFWSDLRVLGSDNGDGSFFFGAVEGVFEGFGVYCFVVRQVALMV
jgi:hypothetical protein